MRKYITILTLAFLLVSCKTNQLYLNVTEPAPVTVPAYIKKVGVINRSMSTDETKAIDVIDKVLSLEGDKLDKEGALESIKGLSDELLNNNRFTEVKVLNDISFKTSKLALFPVPLSWEIVEKICNETGTDALFSLEKFDTDTRISYSNRPVEIKTPLGKLAGLEHQADMNTIVKTGWRIYDPASRAILDEYIFEDAIVFTGRGINPLLAAGALIGRKDAVNKVSNEAGHGYAMRLIPYRLRVYRDYYVKGTSSFKIAKRKAQMGKWDEAGELWKKETENPKMKIAGRAVYNMAIISEINGDLDSALGWAQKSYEDYNNKLGIRYVRILENRKYKNEVLKVQEER
jgi:tetratricopeptide (TPR) repeat protein